MVFEQILRRTVASIFKRYEGNPILEPTANKWESTAVFNAAAIQVGDRKLGGGGRPDDEVFLIYRAIGEDNISRLGLATSQDGFNFQRFEQPILEPELYNKYEIMGIEDPRICFFDGEYHIVYVAVSFYPPNHPKPPWSIDRSWRARVSLARTKDFKNFERDGVILAEEDTKDPALFPERINNKINILHRIFPNISLSIGETWYRWDETKVVARVRPGKWDSDRVGAGGTPIKTNDGWLLIYHGVDKKHVYRQGAMLLDLKDPSRVLARSKEPFFGPEEEYEKNGVVNNVVFSCGAIEKDGELIVYYGAADRVLCAGTVNIRELIGSLEPIKEEGVTEEGK